MHFENARRDLRYSYGSDDWLGIEQKEGEVLWRDFAFWGIVRVGSWREEMYRDGESGVTLLSVGSSPIKIFQI